MPARSAAADDAVRRGRALTFPRDHGAHPGRRTEWWYATGWLGSDPAAPTHGFQVTFFRSRTGFHAGGPSGAAGDRFAPCQLLFAHAALTDLVGARHLHDQRIARWNGAPDAAGARAAWHDADLALGGWTLRREADGTWACTLPARGFTLALQLVAAQPLLLQGDAGFSRKGPDERQASHYYSLPQLTVRAAGPGLPADGRAWMDHEWSDELLHPEAVGWDWIGINLLDGSALTAFRLRRRDGSALWAGGSWRPGGGAPTKAFAPDTVRWQPGRAWRSPASGAAYPVEWTVETPAGTHRVRALLDAQELDSRGSTGSIYWEGLAELLDAGGRRVGLGYLELTGYAAPLRLG
jgi:predicted secreted hydrolase